MAMFIGKIEIYSIFFISMIIRSNLLIIFDEFVDVNYLDIF